MKRETVTLSVKVKLTSDNPKARAAVLRSLRNMLGGEVSQFGVDGYARAVAGAVSVQKPPKDTA